MQQFHSLWLPIINSIRELLLDNIVRILDIAENLVILVLELNRLEFIVFIHDFQANA